MIKKIRDYFKNDDELRGKCDHCGKHVEHGSLYTRYSFDKKKWEEVLVCKGKCYSEARRKDLYSCSILSKKESFKIDIKFIIFIIIVLSITLTVLDYGA